MSASSLIVPPFEAFNKIPRLSRGCVITEKIDGTNAQILITEDGGFFTGSRNRWITPQDDNYGFSAWAHANKEELMKLGPGRHFGEWWGAGIQRRYGLTEKRFSLFNVQRWTHQDRPACCSVVPLLATGPFTDDFVGQALESLRVNGSAAAPGFMQPEGIVVWHSASRQFFKKTLEHDDMAKGAEPITTIEQAKEALLS